MQEDSGQRLGRTGMKPCECWEAWRGGGRCSWRAVSVGEVTMWELTEYKRKILSGQLGRRALLELHVHAASFKTVDGTGRRAGLTRQSVLSGSAVSRAPRRQAVQESVERRNIQEVKPRPSSQPDGSDYHGPSSHPADKGVRSTDREEGVHSSPAKGTRRVLRRLMEAHGR